MSGGYETIGGEWEVPASNGITDLINNSANVPKEISQTIASETISRLLEKSLVARGVGHAGMKAGLVGALVSPAVWIASGRMPQPGDVQLWIGSTVISLLGGLAGSAATITVGVMKAAAEDQEDSRIAYAASWEPERFRPFIRSARNYGTSARGIVAMTIASHGGVAWRVGPSNWCYLTDALGRLVCDYRPVFSYEVYGPELPLPLAGRDGDRPLFTWRMRSGTYVG